MVLDAGICLIGLMEWIIQPDKIYEKNLETYQRVVLHEIETISDQKVVFGNWCVLPQQKIDYPLQLEKSHNLKLQDWKSREADVDY